MMLKRDKNVICIYNRTKFMAYQIYKKFRENLKEALNFL